MCASEMPSCRRLPEPIVCQKRSVSESEPTEGSVLLFWSRRDTGLFPRIYSHMACQHSDGFVDQFRDQSRTARQGSGCLRRRIIIAACPFAFVRSRRTATNCTARLEQIRIGLGVRERSAHDRDTILTSDPARRPRNEWRACTYVCMFVCVCVRESVVCVVHPHTPNLFSVVSCFSGIGRCRPNKAAMTVEPQILPQYATIAASTAS